FFVERPRLGVVKICPGIWVYQQSHRRCAAWALKPLWLPHPFGLHCNLRHPDRRFPPLPSLPAFAEIKIRRVMSDVSFREMPGMRGGASRSAIARERPLSCERRMLGIVR